LGLFKTHLPLTLLLNVPLVVPHRHDHIVNEHERTFTVKLSDVCIMRRDPGPCPGSALRWYYDTERDTCSQFVYGGCKGNANRFRTLAVCQQRCSSQGIDNNEEKKSLIELHGNITRSLTKNLILLPNFEKASVLFFFPSFEYI